VVSVNWEADVADLLFSSTLENAIAEDFASIPQVRNVLIESAQDSLLVWIIADDPNRCVRDRIFQIELDLMDAFPEKSFDFNVIPSLGREIGEIVTNARVLYSRS